MKALSWRRAEDGDARLTWGWVRDPSVWKLSFSARPIPWRTHRAWFSDAVLRPGSLYLIAEDPPGRPVGQVRFEPSGRNTEISIVVAKDLRGQGYGTRLLKEACRRHFRSPGAPPVTAHVRPGNGGSVRAFMAAGFEVAGTMRRHGRVGLTLVLRRPSPRRKAARRGR